MKTFSIKRYYNMSSSRTRSKHDDVTKTLYNSGNGVDF